ncbi:MAG: hypothetical protein Q8P88_01570 [Candidatus Jorgensenbacteria bacterium]|nr:hypothetical protein [Candidatus Jorgensenbacteria bacterium]
MNTFFPPALFGGGTEVGGNEDGVRGGLKPPLWNGELPMPMPDGPDALVGAGGGMPTGFAGAALGKVPPSGRAGADPPAGGGV